jgi:hypothetical protein
MLIFLVDLILFTDVSLIPIPIVFIANNLTIMKWGERANLTHLDVPGGFHVSSLLRRLAQSERCRCCRHVSVLPVCQFWHLGDSGSRLRRLCSNFFPLFILQESAEILVTVC